MKRFIIAVLVTCALVAPAAAQTTGGFTGTGSSINPVTPLPNLTCLPDPMTGGTWDFCNTMQQQIDVYNHYVGILNHIQELKREAEQYMRYPQTTKSNISQDLSQIAGIVQQVKGLSYLSHSIDQDVAARVPDWNPGYNVSDLNTYLEQGLENSIRGVLKSENAQSANIARDTDVVEAIKKASSRSTSSVQTGQMTVQLLSVMYAQMVRQQQATGLQVSQEASYDLQQAAQHHIERQASIATANHLQKRLYPVPPTLTRDQAQAIVNSAPGAGTP